MAARAGAAAMAKIEPKAFLAIESSMVKALTSGWAQPVSDLVPELHRLLAQGKWAAADQLIDTLSLAGAVDNARERIEELAVAALLFGAHHVSGDVSATSFATGKKAIPAGVQQAISQLDISLKYMTAERTRAALHALVADLERQGKQRIYKAEAWLADSELSLADRLNAAVLEGKALVDINASLTTSRLISLGFQSECTVQNVTTYKISEVLDSKTCPVCAFMNGKTFDVASEYSKLMTVLGTTDPNELRGLAPWPGSSASSMQALGSMSSPSLQAAGFGSPPYHPRCRGILVMAGTTVEATGAEGVDQDMLMAVIEAAQSAPMFEAATATATAGEAVAVEGSTASAINVTEEASAFGAELDPAAQDVVAALETQIGRMADPAKREKAMAALTAGDQDTVRQILGGAGIFLAGNV